MAATPLSPEPSLLRVVPVPGKGRGVRAGRRLSCGEVVDAAPVVVIPSRQRRMVEQTVLAQFSFVWDDETGSTAVALGRGSLFNHSYEPNVAAEKRIAARMIHFIALREIEPGEELTLNYHGDAGCRDPIWFEVKP